jgi:hypothetical protein
MARPSNPLLIPLVAVCAVALAEAAALVVLVRRDPPGHTTATAATANPPQGATVDGGPADAPVAAPAVPPRGKAGARVASGGFGITVEKILHEPLTFKELTKVGPNERYVALLIAADNNSGGNAQLFPSQFHLQDAGGYAYDPLNIRLSMPTLEWRTLGNRETVRGHIDFIVPKSAKGLTLVYAGVPHNGPPIYLELGE